MELKNITIGADPELFIINEETGKVVSAVGIIPGEKKKPFIDPSWEKGFGLETDNILAEFNIPPVNSCLSFVNNILFMQNYIRSFVKKINPNYNIKCVASQTVPEEELQSKQAKMFGCDIDYNVYTKKSNPKPKGELTNTRSGGFHIHCGYENHNTITSLELIKLFDVYLGIPSVIKDPDKDRRSLYGKAGCFRLTPYGFEYRTLSSAMMKDRDTLYFVWDQLEKAIRHYTENDYELPSSSIVQDTINSSNVKQAQNLIKYYKII